MEVEKQERPPGFQVVPYWLRYQTPSNQHRTGDWLVCAWDHVENHSNSSEKFCGAATLRWDLCMGQALAPS